jgi:hypothetical protein
MKTRMMRKIAVLVTGSALALSLPVASSFAGQPGGPSNGNGHSHACPSQAGPKKSNSHRNPNGNGHGIGWKCGLTDSD